MFSEPLSVLLGQDKENLSRLRKLTITGYTTPYDIEYAAKIGKLSLDTLDMSGLKVTFYSYEFDIEEREFLVPICRGSCYPKASMQFVMRLLPTVRTSRLLFCPPV